MGVIAALISSLAYPIYIVEFVGGRTKTHPLTAWMWPALNLKGDTHPRLVTWILWLLLTGSIFFIQIRDSNVAPAFISGVFFFGNVGLLIASLASGTWQTKWYDIICFALGIAALVLFLREGDPRLSIAMLILADVIAGTSTFLGVIESPQSESRIAWRFFFLGGSVNILAFTHPFSPGEWGFVETAYTIYIVICTVYMVAMTTFWRPKH